MKIYSIRNSTNIYGYLFMNDDYSDSYIELIEGLSGYPIFFNSFIDKRIYCINSYWTYKWIRERIIPYERMNINSILKDNHIPYYNELIMLISSKGKSSMDDNYIEEIKIDELNISIKNRIDYHIIDFIYTNSNLIVFLKNNETRIIKNVNNNYVPFLSVFGNEIIFNDTIRYDYLYVKEKGEDFLLPYSSLIEYINGNIISSKDITSKFGFSRQYLNKIKNNGEIISLNNDLYIYNNIKLFKKIN